MQELIGFISHIVWLYELVVVAAILMQLLFQFNAIPYSNPMVRSIYQALYSVTEPVLAPIRRRLPKTGTLDLSPLVLILALIFIRSVALPVLQRNLA